jgi:hypothetical protein
MVLNVNGKAATRIDAVWKMEAKSGLSDLYDCEGDEVWVPKSVCRYDKENEMLDIQDWFLQQLQEEGKI